MSELTHDDLNDVDLEELGRLVREGFTNGLITDGKGKYIGWELRVYVWQNDCD